MKALRVPLVFLLTVAAACAPRDAGVAASGEMGGTIVIAASAEPRLLVPALISWAPEKQVVDQVFETLAGIPGSLSTVGDSGWAPRLARRWEWSADSMSIAFHLDPDARFHDGRPVRASDVRFSLALFKDPATSAYSPERFDNVDSISVADSVTATVWYRRRSPEQFFQIAYSLHVVPEHLLAGIDRAKLAESEFARHPVGSGPFRFVRWTPRNEIELVADTTHHLGRPRLDRVLWVWTPDPATALTKVLAGEADVMEALSLEAFTQVRAAASVRAHPYPSLNTGYVAFNLRDPASPARPHALFADRGLRVALTMALDRRTMVRNVLDSVGYAPAGPFPRAWATADTSIAGIPYDSVGAVRLLDSLGWRDTNGDGVRERNGVPLRFTMLFPATSRMRERFAVLLQEQLRRVGVRVDLDAADPATMGPRMFGGQFDVMINSLQLDPTPATLGDFWRSAPPERRGANFSAYTNPALDAVLDSASTETNPARYRVLHRRAYRLMIEDAAGIWLYEMTPFVAAHARVRPVIGHDTWWSDLREWWIPAGERIDRDRIGLALAPP